MQSKEGAANRGVRTRLSLGTSSGSAPAPPAPREDPPHEVVYFVKFRLTSDS